MKNDLSNEASFAWIFGAFLASNLFMLARDKKSRLLEETRYNRAKDKLESLYKGSNE